MDLELNAARLWRLRRKHYSIEGARCSSCGALFYPPRRACPHCGSRDVALSPLPRRGKLVAWTPLYDVGGNFEESRPLYIGVIDLGGARVVLPLTDVFDERELLEGAEVELVFRRIVEAGSAGPIHYGLKARIAK